MDIRHAIELAQTLNEAVNAPDLELYHWTNASNLRSIMRRDLIRGETTHEVNDKLVSGVSLSRNPFFDIQDTYAVSGVKAWRLGFNYRKLSYDHKIIPIRDDRYTMKPRGVRGAEPVMVGYRKIADRPVSSDESEEFVVGDIYPLWHYLSSIAVEARHIDPTLHPSEMEDDFDMDQRQAVTTSDQHLLYDFIAGTIFGTGQEFRKWNATGKHRKSAIRLPDHLPLLVIDRSTHQVHPFRTFYAEHGMPPQRHEDNMDDISMWSDKRDERNKMFNQTTRKVARDL
jgi:hypothetical protein